LNKKLLLSALLVATQNLNIVAQQNNEPSELGVDVMITDNQLEISINFNESFRWENTKYDSIKKFDMRGGGKMPHTINFDDSNNLRWRQTDVVFIGTYQIKQISAEELLTQYIEKHGGFGIRTWSIDNKSGGMRSFNEFTGSYEVLTLKEFADRFDLDFSYDEFSITASVSGYISKIKGDFSNRDNLMNFDTLTYIPFFPVPDLEIEESEDLINWNKVVLSKGLPTEYRWPESIKISLGSISNADKFFRAKINK